MPRALGAEIHAELLRVRAYGLRDLGLMPTVFAHALAGGALGSCAPEALRSRRLVLGLAFVAVLPDADVAGFWLGVPYGDPLGHRGFSHSLPFAALVTRAQADIGAVAR